MTVTRACFHCGEKAPRVVCVVCDSVFAEGTEKSRGCTRERVVQALIDGWFHPAMRFSDGDDLVYFISSVVGETETFEFAGLVSFVDCVECFFQFCLSVWRVHVEQVKAIRTEGGETVTDGAGDVRGREGVFVFGWGIGFTCGGIAFGGN